MRPSQRGAGTATPGPRAISRPGLWPRNQSPELAGEAFGGYTVFEKLGAGGMATVHRAEGRVGGVRKRVALKRLLPSAAADDELRRLFLDEARLVLRLRHRNIAEIYECGCVGDEYFVAMELVAGPTLKLLVQQCARTVGLLPFPIVLNILSQVCDALAYAHDLRDESGARLGLVHRDVSPSNVVLSANGVVKLIDFGIAKTKSTHTQIGVIKGKLGYIAPEYIEGRLDRRADLWAIGVMAHEMLTGRKLFVGDSDFEMLQRIRSAPIEPPSRHNPDVPAELDAIVMTALERDPARRWQNAMALRNALVGVASPSSNAAVVEWFEWVQALSPEDVLRIRTARPAASPARPALPGLPEPRARAKEAPPIVAIGAPMPLAPHQAPTIALGTHAPQLAPGLRIAPSAPALPVPELRRVPSASSSPLAPAARSPIAQAPVAPVAIVPVVPRRDRYEEALHVAPRPPGARRSTAKLADHGPSPWLVFALLCVLAAACSAVGVVLA